MINQDIFELCDEEGRCVYSQGRKEYNYEIEIRSGYKHWFLKNKRHRLEGPAIEDITTDNTSVGYEEWWFDGIEYSLEQHPFTIFRKEYNLTNIYEDWSNDMKILFKLTYGGSL